MTQGGFLTKEDLQLEEGLEDLNPDTVQNQVSQQGAERIAASQEVGTALQMWWTAHIGPGGVFGGRLGQHSLWSLACSW